MSVAVDAPSQSVDLIGRPAFLTGDERVSWVSAVLGDDVFVVDDPARGLSGRAVVTLPVLGELVRVWDGVQEVRGLWLGLAGEKASGGRLEVLLLAGGRVERVSVEPAWVEARSVVTGRADEAVREALTALLGEVRAHGAAVRAHEARIERIVERAHEEADSRGWCDTFDDLMGELGLPRRSRDYSLAVEVRATVYVTRAATSLDAAIAMVSEREAFELLTPGHLSIEVDEED